MTYSRNEDPGESEFAPAPGITPEPRRFPEGPGIAPDSSWDESYRDARANESVRCTPTRGNPGTRVAR